MSEFIYTSNGEPLANERGEILLARAGEIVRCRDCKHYRDRNGAILPSTVCQRLGYYNFKVEPDGFCAWGERRDA